MTWDHAREVIRNGIAIGSHTHTHRVLSRLAEPAQHWELRESKLALEKHLGQPVRTIAYPVGRYGNFTPATMRIAAECGYAGDWFDATLACSAYMPKLFTSVQAPSESHIAATG